MEQNWIEILGWGEEQHRDLRIAGYNYIRDARYGDALVFFEGIVALYPDSAFDRQVLGALYLQLHRYEEALVELDIALTLEPEDLPTQLNRCKALLSLSRIDEGLELAKKIVATKDPSVADLADALLLAYS